MRTLVDLPDEQIKALKSISRQEHLSRAELIRRAISDYLENREKVAQDDAFGLWKNKKQDGLAYQFKIRKDWE